MSKYLVLSVFGMRASTVVIYCSPSPRDIIPIYRTFSKKLSRPILDWIYIKYLSVSPDSEEMMLLNRIRCISDTEMIRKTIKGHIGRRLLYMYEVDCLPGR